MPASLSLPNWLTLDGALGDLTHIIPELQSYADLARDWRAIAAELWRLRKDAPVDDPVKLALYLADTLDDPEIVAIFAALGLADLRDGLARLRTRLADPESPWAKLLRPMSAFVPAARSETPAGADSFGIDDGGKDGLLALKIPKLAAEAAGKAGPAALQFSIDAEAGLACEAGANWPFQGDGVAPGLLRIGGGGKIQTKAGISLPLGQFGTGSAHADASAEGAIGFFFRPASPDRSFAETLRTSLTGLPEPLDLREVRHAMALAGLEGLVIGCSGGVGTGLGLVLGKSIDAPGIVTGTLGVTADLSLRRAAQWVLSLRRVPGGMRFVLSRDRESERKWSVGADLTLDVAPLARQVHDLLLEADGTVRPMLDRIRPFLSPGTYLATQASDLLHNAATSIVDQPDLREALLQDGALALGAGDADRSALVDLVARKIADLAATKAQALLGAADGWANAIVERLVAEVPGLAATGLPEALTARIQPLLGDVQRRFEALVTQLTTDAALSTRLAAELAAAGAQVKAVETQADRLLAGVRELVAKFDDFSRQVLDATAATANTRLQARFAWSGENRAGENYELIGTIADDAAPEADALWRALVAGRMAPFQQILAGTVAAPRGFALDPSSSLSRFVSQTRGFAFEFVLVGLDISITSIVSGTASVGRNAAGDLVVAARGSVLRKAEGLDEARSLRFVSAWDLFLARHGAETGDRRAMAMGISFDHQDENLKPDEVNGLFAGLTAQKLIDPSRQANAMALYQRWRVEAAADSRVRGRISVNMRLPDPAVTRMVAIGRALNLGDKAARAAMFRLAVRAQLATGVATDKQLKSDVETIKQTHTLSGTSDDPIAYLLALWIFDPKARSGQEVRYRAVDQLLPRAGSFVTLLATMARIYDATPVLGPARNPGDMDERQYAAAEKQLAAAARSWLALNTVLIVKFKAALHPALLAFFRLLALMGTPAPGPDAAAIDGLEGDPVTGETNALFVIAMAKDGDVNPTPI